ncbi:MAG: hypothetical protein J3K34DRAFT_37141 [Monoraphidium minutum]|nr:MAG: hypothetical protein J3K34DRAFT_37141 [Monoraphidium minutum]
MDRSARTLQVGRRGALGADGPGAGWRASKGGGGTAARRRSAAAPSQCPRQGGGRAGLSHWHRIKGGGAHEAPRRPVARLQLKARKGTYFQGVSTGLGPRRLCEGKGVNGTPPGLGRRAEARVRAAAQLGAAEPDKIPRAPGLALWRAGGRQRGSGGERRVRRDRTRGSGRDERAGAEDYIGQRSITVCVAHKETRGGLKGARR